jgi:tRNA-Thr(GGU) m(6)t(6)A37 methyltransferase TsaA
VGGIGGTFQVEAIGYVESPLRDRGDAPKQGFEGSPRAWLVFDAALVDALADLRVGDEILVLTWLDRARRNILKVHPRDDARNPLTGVFSTRSPDRPNPIGLHRVRIVSIVDVTRVEVEDLEALHMTPIIDVKPVLKGVADA